jgi:DNA-binding transcriptional LysR family regulator
MAEQILALREQLRLTAGSESVVTGTFRLGVTELVALTWLPKLMERVRELFPLVTLAPEVDLVSTLYRKLADHSIDLVIGPKKDRDRDFVATELMAVEQAFMCSPSFRKDTGPVPLQKLEEMPLLMKPDRSGLQMLLRNLLHENGVQLRSIISCNSMIALASLAESGLGITCLPRFYFQREIERGRLRVVETTPAMPTLQYIAAHRRDTIGDLAPRIAAIAAEVCEFRLAHARD